MLRCINDGHIMIDGGIWANNPIMNAVVDALAGYDLPRETIHVLSVGTGDEVLGMDEGDRKGGLLHWVFPGLAKAPMIPRGSEGPV